MKKLAHLWKKSLGLLTELEEMRHPSWSFVLSLRWTRGDRLRVVNGDHLSEILEQIPTYKQGEEASQFEVEVG